MGQTLGYPWDVPKRAVSEVLQQKIGQRIKWLREALGHTQSDWARALHISNQQLNKWEAGTRMANLDALVTIVLSTGASFDYLFLGRLTQEMNQELVAALYDQHGSELELRVLLVRTPPSTPPSGPEPRRRKKSSNPGRRDVGA